MVLSRRKRRAGRKKVWMSKKKLDLLEKRIAGLEKTVQSQQKDIAIAIGAFENMGVNWKNVRRTMDNKRIEKF